MKAYWGISGIAPRILDLCTRCRSVVSFTPRPLYPKERAAGTQWIGGWVGPNVFKTSNDEKEQHSALGTSKDA